MFEIYTLHNFSRLYFILFYFILFYLLLSLFYFFIYQIIHLLSSLILNDLQYLNTQEAEVSTCVFTSFHFWKLFTDTFWGKPYFFVCLKWLHNLYIFTFYSIQYFFRFIWFYLIFSLFYFTLFSKIYFWASLFNYILFQLR